MHAIEIRPMGRVMRGDQFFVTVVSQHIVLP